MENDSKGSQCVTWDIQSILDFIVFLILFLLSIWIIYLCSRNIKNIKEVKKIKQNANCLLIKCVNMNIIIGSTLRCCQYLVGDVYYIINMGSDKIKCKDDQLNLVYFIFEKISIYFTCLVMIIVSKTWLSLELLQKEQINQKKFQAIRISCSLIWMLFLMFNIIQILTFQENQMMHNMNQDIIDGEIMVDIDSSLSRYLTMVQIFVTYALFLYAILKMYYHIKKKYDVNSQLKMRVRFGWVVCLVSSIIRIALNIFITFQPKEQEHNKSYQDQDYWSIIIFSFGFFGDLVPSFYILKMFDPQWRKQQQMQQEFFVKKENLGNEELEDFNEQYDYSFNNIDDSEEENDDSFGNEEYQQNQNSGSNQKQTNNKVSSKNSSRKKK